MQIEYIAQWEDCADENSEREFSPAGVAKMDYYLSVFEHLGADVEVYTTCPRRDKGFSFCKTVDSPKRRVRYRASFKSSNPRINYLDLMFGQLQLAIKLLFLNRRRTVVFYHERLYTPVLKYIAKIRRLRYILDVEEVYTLAAERRQKYIDKELKSLTGARAYILATRSLESYVDARKPKVICNGNYSPPAKINGGDRKRVLYSGTFDRKKGGAQIAVAAAAYLPADFTLVICGFGTESEVAEIENAICAHNNSGIGCKIEYHGKLTGESYISVLKSCGLGLACQNPSHKLCATSFPSKIFEYLRAGLSVISSDVEVVRHSVCAPAIVFFSPFDANELAHEIITTCRGGGLCEYSQIAA